MTKEKEIVAMERKMIEKKSDVDNDKEEKDSEEITPATILEKKLSLNKSQKFYIYDE